jgi:hypothetical protein
VIAEHAAAVLALLQAVAGPPALNVHDGGVPEGINVDASPYALVYFDSSDPELTFEAGPWRFEMTATVHAVGGNAAAARMVADRVRTALLGVVPTVTNRVCFPITRELGGIPPQRDETTGRLVMDEVDQYVIRSLPG